MEDKQLNFNQPLLSVRRFSSTVASQNDDRRKDDSSLPTAPSIPSYKPEMKSSPLTNPGSIPFVWEHSPGKPKDETKTQEHAKERPPKVPKPPPGRILKPKMQGINTITEDTNVTKGPTKGLLVSHSVLQTEEKLTKCESLKETKKECSDSGGDDDDDEVYIDALDTLSQSDSFFYNCSVSGVSGLESDVKSSGTFSTDPKTRDFMMGRFLPAAKAMASEVPQHAPRKQHVGKEKPQEVKKVVYRDNKKPQLMYGPNFLQSPAHDNEEEDSEFDYDEHGNISSKVCGLIPHSCLKGSFGLLNPVPGSRMRTRLPMSPASRTHFVSSSASFRPARVAIYEKPLGKPHLAKHQEDKNVLKNASTENQNNFRKLEGLGLYSRLQVCGISNVSQSYEAPVSERKELNSPKKGLISFKELLADENDKETDVQSPMVEKTLYVDTVHKMESSKANSLSSNIKAQSNFRESNVDIFKDVHTSTESLESDLFADKSKQDKEMETQTSFCKDPKVDHELYTLANKKVLDNMNGIQNLKVSRQSWLELPAPPPLPKSPSDSWLWRTLPSLSSKNAPLRSNRKYPSSNATSIDPKSDKNVQVRYSQGLLLPIPET